MRSDLRREECAMRDIVTDEQRRSRTEAGLPSIYFASLKRGDPIMKGRALLRGERRRSSVTYSRYAPSSLLVTPQNRPAKTNVIIKPQHSPMKNKGVTLIELMMATFVVGIALLVLMRFTSTSQKGLTTSIESLHAQSSADELLVTISRTKWDRNKPDGAQMNLIGPPLPLTSRTGGPRDCIERYNNYNVMDTSRAPFGPFRRRVSVDFVTMDAGGTLVRVSEPTHRKRVIVTAAGRKSTGTATAVFYNLP
jgi:prepilin-type N-terminal cleavage/methylation domain-containing protein